MKRIGWAVPIIFFSVCIAGLFSYQNKQQISVSRSLPILASENMDSNIWSNSATDVTQVTYTINDKLIYAKRFDNSWYLPDFNNRLADSGYIYSSISPFLNPVLHNPILINDMDLPDYGIDDLSPTIKFYTTSGEILEVVKGKAFDESYDYVYIPNSETIYTMNNTAFSNLSVSTQDWLSKAILNFDPNNVEIVDLVYKGHSATLTPILKDNSISFDSQQFDESLSNEFISFLTSLQIDKFITNDINDHVLTEYGFSSPILHCTISLKDGNTLSLTIADINESDDICYAKVNGHEEIVTIPYFSLSEFNMLYTQFKQENNHDEEA